MPTEEEADSVAPESEREVPATSEHASTSTGSWSRRSILAYAAIVIGTTIAVVGPSNLGRGNGFIAWTGTEIAGPVPGDHLQIAYQLWLWHDSITGGGHWPWIDPYLFGASGDVVAMFGWPLVLVTLPISLVAGPVAAYNAAVLLGFVLAAAATAAWVRTLSLRPVAAGAAGLAYALAPYRIWQSTGHANAMLAWMFPALLACIELAIRGDERRARMWGFATVGVMISIVVAGEFHHSVFAVLLIAGYGLARRPRGRTNLMSRVRLLLPPVVIGGAATGAGALLLYETVIGRSSAGDGRTMDETARYAPRAVDLVTQSPTRSVYVGAVIGVLALAGLIVSIVLRRHRGLATTFAAGWAVCAWFSIAPSFVNHPMLQDTYRLVPFFSFSRVPGRLMVVGSLLAAGLVAIAFEHLGRRSRMWMLVPLAALLMIDLPLPHFGTLSQGGDPYDGLAEDATILEFPIYDPSHFGASPYSWYITRHPGPRVGGYFVIVRDEYRDLLGRASDLENNRIDDRCRWRTIVEQADIDLVAVHRDRYGQGRGRVASDLDAELAALHELPGLDEVRTKDGVTVFEVTDPTFSCEESQ